MKSYKTCQNRLNSNF